MKKILFMLVAVLGMTTMSTFSYAQSTPKELKKATSLARRVVKDAKEELAKLNEGGKLENAKKMVDQATANELTKDWSETWSVAGDVYQRLYLAENRKSYNAGVPYDTVAMYDYLIKMYDYFIKCDSLEQIPNEKGKTSTACRDRYASSLDANRNNLINGGIFYFNSKKNYKKAYDMFEKYYQIAETPMLKSYTEDNEQYKEYAIQFAYFPTLAAFQMGDYQKVLKYVDMGIEDPENGETCLRFKCQAYENLKDSANWIKSLQEGIMKFPTQDYYYMQLIIYYDSTGKIGEMETFVEDMVKKDPNKAYNYYVIGYLRQSQKKYADAASQYEIAIEKDPELTEAYINLGLCYINEANEYIDSKPNVNYRSAEGQKVLETEKGYYRKAMPLFEKVRQTMPDEIDKWGIQLYSIYYKLNMTKELTDIEKVLKSAGLL